MEDDINMLSEINESAAHTDPAFLGDRFNMSGPLVSVIIAVKNGERFLSSAINSAVEQDYQPIELITVDGQSTDSTPEIAKSFREIRYIRQTNQGIADAWNVGIDAAKGEFVAFLSHDDLWTPDKLSVQINYMLNHQEIQYTVSRVRFFLEPGYRIPPGFRKELLNGDHVGHIMETLVAYKSLFTVIGRFDPTLTISEDVDWFARASDSNIPVAVIPKVLLLKRVHDANITLNTPTGNQDLLRALRRSIARKRAQEYEKDSGESSKNDDNSSSFSTHAKR
jgi:glycosyltransferase involved in cell wall biosynthesis